MPGRNVAEELLNSIADPVRPGSVLGSGRVSGLVVKEEHPEDIRAKAKSEI